MCGVGYRPTEKKFKKILTLHYLELYMQGKYPLYMTMIKRGFQTITNGGNSFSEACIKKTISRFFFSLFLREMIIQ